MSTALVSFRASSTMAVCEQAAALLERVKVELPECEDIEKLVELRDMSEAMKVFLRQRCAAETSQIDAAEIKIRTERRIGELTEKMPKLSPQEARAKLELQKDWNVTTSAKEALKSKKERLTELGLSERKASDWGKLARLPEEQFEEVVGSLRTKAESVTSAKAAVFSSESDEWYTPQEYIESAREVLGVINLDPASNPTANEKVKAEHFFTMADNGLREPWEGNVWLNPPYGEHEESNVGTWARKMVDEYEAGHMRQGIILVNDYVERSWAKPLYRKASAVCRTDHRIKFYTPSGTPRSPVNGSAFWYFGNDVKLFAKAFAKHGPVWGKRI